MPQQCSPGLYGPSSAIDTPVSYALSLLSSEEYSQFFYFAKSIRKIYPPGAVLVIVPCLLWHSSLFNAPLENVRIIILMVPEICTASLVAKTFEKCVNLEKVYILVKFPDVITEDTEETSGWYQILEVLKNVSSRVRVEYK